MKKLLTIVATALMLGALLPATSAVSFTKTENCVPHTNDAGGKRVRICVSVQATDNQDHAWGKVTLDKVSGYQLPYAMSQGSTIFWSSNAQIAHCEGRYPGCSGNGNGNGFIIQDMQASATPYTDTTDHYAASEHLCEAWTEAHAGKIYWTATDLSNGVYDTYNPNSLPIAAFGSGDCTN